MQIKDMSRDEILTELYFGMYRASGVYREHPWPYECTLEPYLDVYKKEVSNE